MTQAQLISEASAIREYVHQAKCEGKSVGFVPTMGALHQGHISLMQQAAATCDLVIASIYVNPTQFGPNEDFTTYPRDLEGDFAKAAQAGVALVFAPDEQTLYPGGAAANRTWVQVEGLTQGLCGAFRDGHFKGVTTIVTRLFNIVQPTHAFFGQKDYQQLAVLRRMAEDLAMPITLVGCPIVREADGLAMSSRNLRLSAKARQQALALVKGLRAAHRAYTQGKRDPQLLCQAAIEIIQAEPAFELQYLELVDAATLEPFNGPIEGDAVMALAAFIEGVRLIDNCLLPGPRP